MMRTGLIFSRPKKEIVQAILESLGENPSELRCSICGEEIDLRRLGAIYPYKSALICCDKLECILKCGDLLVSREE